MVKFPKLNPERDKKYRAWVRTHPCLVGRYFVNPFKEICQGQVVDHHIESLGTGIKCSDYLTVPVCNAHHREVERSREIFEKRYNIDLKEEAERLRREYVG